MSSPKTRARNQARFHAHKLAKIASDALETLNMFIENNEEHLCDALESLEAEGAIRRNGGRFAELYWTRASWEYIWRPHES